MPTISIKKRTRDENGKTKIGTVVNTYITTLPTGTFLVDILKGIANKLKIRAFVASDNLN